MNVQCLSVLQDGGMLQQIFPASLLKLASADVNVLFARPARGYLINSRPMPECEKHNPQPRMWGSLCSQEAGNYLCSVSLRAKKKGEKTTLARKTWVPTQEGRGLHCAQLAWSLWGDIFWNHLKLPEMCTRRFPKYKLLSGTEEQRGPSLPLLQWCF